jgi:hypothetical protein
MKICFLNEFIVSLVHKKPLQELEIAAICADSIEVSYLK